MKTLTPAQGSKTRTVLRDRFWSFVPERPADGCWEWVGSRDKNGYGRIQIGTHSRPRVERAHRLSWQLHHGEIPDGELVAHSCRNNACVRPDHLYLTTMSLRIREARSEGYRGFGREMNNPNCKLTYRQVVNIRRLYECGGAQGDLARCFGVDKSTIWNIVRGARRIGVYAAREVGAR